MKNKRGQALVEFIIILPIFIFMLLSIIDVGKIIYTRNQLESNLSDVINLYKNQKSYDNILNELNLRDENIELEIKNENNQKIIFYLNKKIEIITPGLNLIFQKPFFVKVNRVLSYES